MTTSKCKCCCNKCQIALDCDDCCGCIPKEICVTVVGTGESCTCTSTAAAIAEYDCYTGTWSGSIICGDITFDFSVYIKADESGQCYLYLDSDCLSSTLSEPLNAPLSNPADAYGPNCVEINAAWTGVSHTCGDVNCTSIDITVAAADRMEVPVETCQEDCLDCRCVCQTLCIFASGDGCDAQTTAIGHISNGIPTWAFALTCGATTINGTLTLECYGGVQRLYLTTDQGDGIDGIRQEDCPQITASWDIGDYTIIVRCKDCGPCDSTEIGCCDFADLGITCPSSLTISFCGCTGTIPNTDAGACYAWSGSISDCGGQTFNLDVDCIGGNSDGTYRLSIGCDAISPNQVTSDAIAFSCDPFILIFEVDNLGTDCTPCTSPFYVVVTG